MPGRRAPLDRARGPSRSTAASPPVRIVVGVDGAGRTHRLLDLAPSHEPQTQWFTAPIAEPGAFATQVVAATADGHRIVVDDAHHLTEGEVAVVSAAVRQGLDLLISRRPTISTAALADLDTALVANGRVEHLSPLDAAGIALLVEAVRGEPAEQPVIDRILHNSGGMPAVVAELADATHSVTPALTARLERRLTGWQHTTADLAAIAAVGVEIPDDVLASLLDLAIGDLAEQWRILRDEGLVTPDGERLIPAYAEALEHRAGPAGRRAVRERIALALHAGGHDPLRAAELLRQAHSRGQVAADLFVAAAQTSRLVDPVSALRWLDDADALDPRETTEPPGLTRLIVRAEARAQLGLPAETTAPDTTTEQGERLRRAEAVIAAHQGRSARCARLLRPSADSPEHTQDPLDALLAVPALMATGQPIETSDPAFDGPAPAAVTRLAYAAQAAADPDRAVPLFLEAAEVLQALPAPVVLPETAHALGALVAVRAGDPASAERLLTQAIQNEIGGPAHSERHRLLLAWVRLRAGRFDTARTEIQRPAAPDSCARNQVIRAALLAGLARRSGDIAKLRQAWADIEPVLARRAIDLFQVEIVEELAVAAARLGHHRRVGPVVDLISQFSAGLGDPPAWLSAIGWLRLQMALATEDHAGLDQALHTLSRAVDAASEQAGDQAASRERAQTLCTAAEVWSRVVRGHSDDDADEGVAESVDESAVTSAVQLLTEANLPWEGSRLAGQAALNCTDATLSRRFLELARDLAHIAHPGPGEGGSAPSSADGGTAAAALSEREREVAHLVLEGRTHREIGAQLYLSPKTVEHHVARMRHKLGASNRAEFLATLREVLTD